jgi:hypothetical protein
MTIVGKAVPLVPGISAELADQHIIGTLMSRHQAMLGQTAHHSNALLCSACSLPWYLRFHIFSLSDMGDSIMLDRHMQMKQCDLFQNTGRHMNECDVMKKEQF